MLRDENERRNTAGGREISCRSVEGNGGEDRGGKQSRQRRKEYATTFAFCARDASRGRDAPINRRRDVGRSHTHAPTSTHRHACGLSFSLCLTLPLCFPPSYLSLLASRRPVYVAYARVELLRSRAARAPGAADTERGVSGDPSTSGYRSATPLRAFLFLSLAPASS